MKPNDKAINEKNYNKTKRGSKKRLKKIRKGNIILSKNDKEIKREAYKNDESVFDPDNPTSMKIATVRARRVIPHYRQRSLSHDKLNELRLIIVVDCIQENVLYLNVTSPKPFMEANARFMNVDNILSRSNRYKYSVIDLDMDELDYSLIRTKMKFDKIRINNTLKLSNKTMQQIYRAVNSRIKNINMSRRLKQNT